MDPLDIDPEGAQRAHEIAAQNHRSIFLLRLGALALVLGTGLVLIRGDAAIYALWILPAVLLFFGADFKFAGLAEAYGAVAAQHESGTWEPAPVDDTAGRDYRNEYYGLLALALLAVAVRA